MLLLQAQPVETSQKKRAELDRCSNIIDQWLNFFGRVGSSFTMDNGSSDAKRRTLLNLR